MRLWSDGSKVRRSVPSFITPRTWRIYYCCAIGAIAVPDDMMRRSERMKYGTQNLFIRKGLQAVICLFFLCASFFLFFQSANAVVRPIVFPVEVPYYFRDDYLDPRGGGTRKHLGTDIIADKMKKIFSASDGVVTYVVSPEASWGYAIEVRDTDGYTYNYLHLNNDTPGTDDGKGGEGHAYAPEIENGVRVSKGQFIGWVGDSGNAEETPPHLHFEIEDPRGMHINPYDSLLSAAGLTVAPEPPPGTVTYEERHEIDFDPVYRDAITRELVFGDRGDMVQLLQAKLQKDGYYTSAYITDYFDSITKDSVIRLQRAYGLDATGRTDYPTRLLLNIGTGFVEPSPEPVAGIDDEHETNEALSEGARGPEVTALQVNLRKLGYYTSSLITDYFGPITKAAVIRFQTAHGMDPVGVVGPHTRAAMEQDLLTMGSLTFISDLESGMKGREVDELQARLKELGFYTSTYITGIYDSLTRDAVTRFQRSRGIDPVGVVGPQTRAALNGTSIPFSVPSSSSAPAPSLRQQGAVPSPTGYVFTGDLEEGARGEAVRQLQIALTSFGFFTYSATGYFGPITKSAVMRYQAARGIEPIGIVGPKTRASLNAR